MFTLFLQILALTRFLVEYPISDMPPPRALLLLSPWADVTASHEDTRPESSAVRNHKSDYLMKPSDEIGKVSTARQNTLNVDLTERLCVASSDSGV